MLEGQEDEAFPEQEAPPPVLDVPPPFTPPPPVVEAQAPAGDPAPDLTFPEEHRQPFEGLLLVGKLVDEITVAGHKIVIKTLSSDEILAVGMVSAPWLGTESAIRAYVSAVIGACIETIDRRPLPTPLRADADLEEQIRDRFNWTRELNPFVQDRIYDAYRALEAQVERILDAMGGASG